MEIKLHTWENFDLNLPKTNHTYDEILTELRKKDNDSAEYLTYSVKNWPQTKEVVPYFYDFIFATNYKDTEKWFIKSLLKFDSSYESEMLLFSLVDVTGSLWIPCLIWWEYYFREWVIYCVCKLFSEINEFSTWFSLDGIATRKQIRIVLKDCLDSDNPLKTWKKRIQEVQYNVYDIRQEWKKDEKILNKALYLVNLPYREKN